MPCFWMDLRFATGRQQTNRTFRFFWRSTFTACSLEESRRVQVQETRSVDVGSVASRMCASAREETGGVASRMCASASERS